MLTIEGTKSGRARFVPINSVLADVLGNLKALGRDRMKVFPFKSVTTAFRRACRRAGLEDFHFPDLRRTFGTRLLERGADIVTVSRLLGHSTVVVTKRYLHPADALASEAVERLVGGGEKIAAFSENLSNAGQTAQRGKSQVPASLVFSVS